MELVFVAFACWTYRTGPCDMLYKNRMQVNSEKEAELRCSSLREKERLRFVMINNSEFKVVCYIKKD